MNGIEKIKITTATTMVKVCFRMLIFGLITPSLFILFGSCSGKTVGDKEPTLTEKLNSLIENEIPDEYQPVNAMLVLPQNPAPDEGFRILATGGKNIRKAKIEVTGPSGNLESLNSKTGEELPCWRMDDFAGSTAGKYRATLILDKIGRASCRERV